MSTGQLAALLARYPDTRPEPDILATVSALNRNDDWCACFGNVCRREVINGKTATGQLCRACASIGGRLNVD